MVPLHRAAPNTQVTQAVKKMQRCLAVEVFSRRGSLPSLHPQWQRIAENTSGFLEA